MEQTNTTFVAASGRGRGGAGGLSDVLFFLKLFKEEIIDSDGRARGEDNGRSAGAWTRSRSRSGGAGHGDAAAAGEARRRNGRGARGRRCLLAIDAAAGMAARVQSQRDGRRNAVVGDAAGLVRFRPWLRPRDDCGAAFYDVAGQQSGGRCRRGHGRATGPLRWARTWRHRRAWIRP